MKEYLKPTGDGWIYRGRDPRNKAAVYHHLDGMCLLSSIDHVFEDGPSYHVSVSKGGARCSPGEALLVLESLNTPFPATQWEEDNHPGPGKPAPIARHFWVPVDPLKRRPCDCKGNEKPVVEGDYTWRPDSKSDL